VESTAPRGEGGLVDPDAAYRGRTVLITGASGFLGTALRLRLSAAGAVVHAISRRESDDQDARWWNADLTAPDSLAELLHAAEPEVVFHLAGETSAGRALDLVRSTFEANVVTTVNLLASLTKSSPKTRVVLAGSLEEPDLRAGGTPTSPYALSKSTAAAYGALFQELYGLSFVHLRIFMAYGPGQAAVSKLVPYVTLSLLRGEPAELSSGTREIDWIYVDDAVHALAAAGLENRAAGQTLDVCSGTTASVRRVAEEIVRLLGRGELRFGALEDRLREEERVGDPEPAKRILGWQATTPLQEGLRRTVEWYRERLERGELEQAG
jgi:nucleoside-diphosphate-sugar epimerase